jgi:hypothetical protein
MNSSYSEPQWNPNDDEMFENKEQQHSMIFSNNYSQYNYYHYQQHNRQQTTDHFHEKKESQEHSHALSYGVDLLHLREEDKQIDHQPITYSYEVYFKCSNGTYLSNLLLKQGDFVVVEADRGADIGVVNSPLPSHFDSLTLSSSAKILSKLDLHGRPHDGHDQIPDFDLNQDPNQTLQEMFLKKISLENKALIFARAVCSELNVTHLLNIIGTEFQFDRKKLTVYYQKLHPEASLCKLIRRLFAIFKMRIWMENITIDTDCENLNNMLSLFQPNVKRFLELTSLPITEDEVYLFVPGLKESWSQYENNREIRDENTELLFASPSPTSAPAVASTPASSRSSSSESDIEKKSHSVSPLSTNSSSGKSNVSVNVNHVHTATSHHKPQHRVTLPRPRVFSSHFQSNNPQIHQPIATNLTAASLLSVPYQPQFFSPGIGNQQDKKPLFVHSDYLQSRGHLPPPPPAPNLFSDSPPPNSVPIKLGHLPPDSFYRVSYSSPSSSTSSSSNSSSTTTLMHQPHARHLHPHFNSLPPAPSLLHYPIMHTQSHLHKQRQPFVSSGNPDPNRHYLQPSPHSITASSYNEDRNINPSTRYPQPHAGNSQEINSYNFLLAPNYSHSPQLHHHQQQSHSQPLVPAALPQDSSSYGRGGPGAYGRGSWNLQDDHAHRNV